MAYLATFCWGWLLASLLLGFAMGWNIRGFSSNAEGCVSKKYAGGLRRWRRHTGGEIAGGARACSSPRPLQLLRTLTSADRDRTLSLGLCGRIMFARLGGFTQRAAAHDRIHGPVRASPPPSRGSWPVSLPAFSGAPAGPRCQNRASRRRVCCKTVPTTPHHQLRPNNC